jgi:protein SCO1/2
MRAREGAALAAGGVILAITGCWWALALWPLPDQAPAWLARTRVVCFGSTPTGLPDAAGWIAVAGQPALMLGTLLVGWGDSVRRGLSALLGSYYGRLLVGIVTGVTLTGLGALGTRLAGAAARRLQPVAAASQPGDSIQPRLDRPAPPLELLDQTGGRFTLDRLRGRVVLVTFAYGHCETVCPLLVADVLQARRVLLREGRTATAAVIVTLDPWRDTPARLPALASRWGLEHDTYVLGGSVTGVQEALERWGVAATRDATSGNIVHGAVVYIVDRDGRIAFRAGGDAALITSLARRL